MKKIKPDIPSFEDIKGCLTKLLENHCEPELSLWLDGREYMIILYDGFCTFQLCGTEHKSEEFKFKTLDELYNSKALDGIVLKERWGGIEKIECLDFDYLEC